MAVIGAAPRTDTATIAKMPTSTHNVMVFFIFSPRLFNRKIGTSKSHSTDRVKSRPIDEPENPRVETMVGVAYNCPLSLRIATCQSFQLQVARPTHEPQIRFAEFVSQDCHSGICAGCCAELPADPWRKDSLSAGPRSAAR